MVYGGADGDGLQGGLGDDALYGGASDENSDGNRGDDVLHGGAGSNDSAYGGLGDDSLHSGAGDDFLGQVGDDALFGGGGDDFLFGGPGDDGLSGGKGADILYSSVGSDVLMGGAGSDTFEFASRLAGNPGPDRIVDFTSAEDRITLHQFAFGFDFDGSLSEDDFFAGSSNGTSVQGADDALIYHTDTGRLFFDGNGQAAGGRTLIATLQGAPDLVAGDFVIEA